MNEFGLDLAVIGNGQTAALLEPASRLVWWCYPRFNGDPVFSRLLAGDEEKGFCDVVLDGMVDFSSDYERNTPIVSTVLSNSQNASVKITDFVPLFAIMSASFGRLSLSASSSPLPGFPASRSASVPPATMESRSRTARSAATTSPSRARIWRSGSPPTDLCHPSSGRRLSS